MVKKALVTLTLGKQYELEFNTYCRRLWAQYAERHHFDLVVINQPLDKSPRSQSRSPAWQKCLIFSVRNLCTYERVVWVDSDVMINPNSPDITAHVPIEKIGAVDEYASPTKEDNRLTLERLYEFWRHQGIPYIDNLDPKDYYKSYGLKDGFDSVMNTGVMVLSPRYHREILEYVYYNYEDKGESRWAYEMRPLSYEILKQRMEFWISPKFNMLWPLMKMSSYPFLTLPYSFTERILRKLGRSPRATLLSRCVTTTFLNNYFLHFAARTVHDMKYVNTEVTSVFKL